jgi:hypothetical protein
MTMRLRKLFRISVDRARQTGRKYWQPSRNLGTREIGQALVSRGRSISRRFEPFRYSRDVVQHADTSTSFE